MNRTHQVHLLLTQVDSCRYLGPPTFTMHFIYVFICVFWWGEQHTRAIAHSGVWLVEMFSLFTTWVLTELKSLGSAASISTHWAILVVPPFAY